MTGNKQFVSIDDGLDFSIKHIESGEVFYDCDSVVELLNELNDENQLLKCALALDAITNISLNDKKVDIPPYYEFENYQKLKKERGEEYDEYW